MRVEVLDAASKTQGLGTALRAERLARRYRSGAGELVVFEELSVTVETGEMVAIVGESGTGKSSLLHLLSGLDRPSGGDVYFGARSLASMGEDALAEFRNREIGFVWQQSYLLPEFTAQENVMMPLLIAGRGQGEASRTAQAWLERVGVGARHAPAGGTFGRGTAAGGDGAGSGG